jgi:fructosamine-3-kinase
MHLHSTSAQTAPPAVPAATRDAMSRAPAGPLAAEIEAALGRRIARLRPLGGGCIAAVFQVVLEDGGALVAKRGEDAGGLACEAYMLRYLATHSALPVPAVHHAGPALLIMDYIDGGDPIDAAAETHAAELMAALHDVGADRFGHERDTVIGGLPQPNPPSPRWLDFFRDWRLLYMAHEALRHGGISAALMARLERFAARLGEFIEEPARPSLVHGDLWAGNILARQGRIAGLIDPAVYHADPEIELAFATLFRSLGEPFFRRYGELRPLRPGFFETRRDIYNLYPLLVHARLFGGHYASAVERTLRRFGA